MALPQLISVATPASSDSPSGAPALFQNIKQFLVDVFGIADNTSYQVKALDVSATTGVITVQVAGLAAKDITLTRGSITSGLVLDSSVTWSSAGTTFTGWKLNVTDTNSAAGSILLDLQVASVSKFGVKKDGSFTVPVGVGSGGIGTTGTPTNGQLPIGNGTGFTLAALTGTANQVNITNSTGSVTLSLPQSVNSTAAPTFASIVLSTGTNALTIGSANLVTTVATSKTWTLPDVSGTVITTGNLTSITTAGTITSGVWQGTVVATTYGGTGLASIGTANQVLGSNNAANALEYKTLTGTSNQVTVTHAANSVTFATPQSINSTADVTFATVTLGTTASTVGNVRLPNATNVAWRNAANSANVTFGLDANNILVASASIRLPNVTALVGRNAADSANINLIQLDASNRPLVGPADATNIRMGGQVRCDVDTNSRLVLPVGTSKYAT